MSLKNFTRARRALTVMAAAGSTAALLAACTPPSANTGGGSGGNSSAPITIAWESGSKAAMDEAAANFRTQNPGATVNVQYLTPDQMNSTLTTQLAAGSGPDLFRSDAGGGTPKAILTLANRGLLAPFTGSWTSSVPQQISANVTKDGQTYGMVPTIAGVGQVLNEDLLKKYNLTAPTTWSGVLDFCKAARAKGTIAYTAGVASSFEARTVLYAMSDQAVYRATPTFDADVTSGKLTWPNSGWREAVDKNLEMAKAGCFPDDFTGIDVEGAFGQLFGGKVLGIVGYSAYLQYAKPGANFGFYPLPLSENPDDSGMVVSAFGAMGLNKASKNPELAQKFADYMADPKVNAEFVKKASPPGGLLSPFYAQGTAPTDQVGKQLVTYLTNGHSNNFPDATFPSAQVTTTLEQQMQLALAGKASTDQVLNAVQTAWTQAAKK